MNIKPEDLMLKEKLEKTLGIKIKDSDIEEVKNSLYHLGKAIFNYHSM